MRHLSTLFIAAFAALVPLQTASAGIILIPVTDYQDPGDLEAQGNIDGDVTVSDDIDLRFSRTLNAAQVSAIQSSGSLTVEFSALVEVDATGNASSSVDTTRTVRLVAPNGTVHVVDTATWTRDDTESPNTLTLSPSIDLSSYISQLSAGTKVQLWIDGEADGSTGGTAATDTLDVSFEIDDQDKPTLEY